MSLNLSLRFWFCTTAVALLLPMSAAHAFSDDEARKAILDLRQRVEAQRQATDNTMKQQANSILELSNQIQELRSEVAVLRGRVEQLERTTTTLSAQSAPREITVDGKTFTATPQEIEDYEAGIDRLRTGDYAGAVSALQGFMSRWSRSGYMDSAYFWLGNAQYGNRQYKDAVASFTALLERSPNHARAPEALLSIANCQVELKSTQAMRATLERLIRDYPQSDVANQARTRLGQMR